MPILGSPVSSAAGRMGNAPAASRRPLQAAARGTVPFKAPALFRTPRGSKCARQATSGSSPNVKPRRPEPPQRPTSPDTSAASEAIAAPVEADPSSAIGAYDFDESANSFASFVVDDGSASPRPFILASRALLLVSLHLPPSHRPNSALHLQLCHRQSPLPCLVPILFSPCLELVLCLFPYIQANRSLSCLPAGHAHHSDGPTHLPLCVHFQLLHFLWHSSPCDHGRPAHAPVSSPPRLSSTLPWAPLLPVALHRLIHPFLCQPLPLALLLHISLPPPSLTPPLRFADSFLFPSLSSFVSPFPYLPVRPSSLTSPPSRAHR